VSSRMRMTMMTSVPSPMYMDSSGCSLPALAGGQTSPVDHPGARHVA